MISEYKVLFKRYFVIFYVIYFPYVFDFFSAIETHLNAKKEIFFRLRLRFYAWKEFVMSISLRSDGF